MPLSPDKLFGTKSNGTSESLIEQAKRRMNERMEQESKLSQPEQVVVSEEPQQTVDLSKFMEVWNAYLESRNSAANRGTYNTIRTASVEQKSETRFVFVAASKLQCEFLESERQNMLPYFRSTLQNTLIDWDYEVREINNSSTEFLTAEQKFKKLTEQYPMLEEFRKAFDMELGY